MRGGLAWRTAGLLAALSVVAIGICWIARHEPGPSSFYPPCLFHKATSLHCPGCGTGRAAHFLLNAQWEQAIRMNPLLFVSVPFIVALLVRPGLARTRFLPLLVGLVLVGYWILRNLPGFEWLAPPA